MNSHLAGFGNRTRLLHGCQQPDLRNANTVAVLKGGRSCGLVNSADADTLINGYKFLRKLENRLRIIHDYSVNDLTGSRSYINKLARRLGYDPKLRNPGAALLSDYEEITSTIRSCFDKIFRED